MPRVILPLTMGWFLVCGFLLAVGWSKTITATNVPVVLSKHVAGINDAGVLANGGQNPGDILFSDAEEEFETFLNCDDSAEPQREEAMHDAEQDRDQEKSEAELQQELQQIDETLQDRDICGMRIYTLTERRQTIIKEFHRRSDPTPLQGAVAARGIEGLTDEEAVLLEEVAPEHTCQLIAQAVLGQAPGPRLDMLHCVGWAREKEAELRTHDLGLACPTKIWTAVNPRPSFFERLEKFPGSKSVGGGINIVDDPANVWVVRVKCDITCSQTEAIDFYGCPY
jgi:hypothetical protein